MNGNFGFDWQINQSFYFTASSVFFRYIVTFFVMIKKKVTVNSENYLALLKNVGNWPHLYILYFSYK